MDGTVEGAMDAPAALAGVPAGFAHQANRAAEETQETELAGTVWDRPPAQKCPASTWQLTDFFLLSETEEVTLKKLIAQKLGIHYGICNQDKPFAEDCGGIKAYTVEGITNAREAFRAKLHGSDLEGTARAKALADTCHLSVVVSGCLIKWKPSQVVNEGYVEDWMRKNVVPGKWDSSVERRAALANDVGPFVTRRAKHQTRLCVQSRNCKTTYDWLPRTSPTCTSWPLECLHFWP